MSYYATEMLARSRQVELLKEASDARLARIARDHQRRGHPRGMAIQIAVRHLAAAASTLLR
jgi:hypothetical protein